MHEKVACSVYVNVPNYPVPIIAAVTHLYHLKSSLLDEQIEELRHLFSPWEIRRKGIPLIMGDLNIFPGSEEYNRMTLTWTDTDASRQYTAPSWNPDRKVDYILTSNAQKWDVKSVWVPKPDDTISTGEKYSEISDHLPLVVKLQLIEQ